MRLYRIAVNEVQEWAGTEADAKTIRRGMMVEHNAKLKDVKLEQEDVPVDKAGLLSFLKKHATNPNTF